MNQRVYIETSIPSFYHEIRTEPEMIARRSWTREWWEQQSYHYELVTSLAVIEELERGDYPTKSAALALMKSIPILPVEEPIPEIVEAYIARKLMPDDVAGDAFHLAMASYHQCHFLLTWNCQNLANANKFDHIRRVNTILGLFVPMIVTPFELLVWESDSDKDET
ncbi:MAG: type II toxin-antitoxin system VapC family toxin [Candidatus Desantisbacteria bacterium]